MGGRLTWIGFLAMAFMVVGLAGLFACFALPIALDRAAAQTAALDAGGDAASRITAVLGAAAAQPILQGPGDDAAKLRAASRTVLQQAVAEQNATALRLRWLIVIVSLMGAAFGAAVLGSAGPGRRDSAPSPPP